MVYIFFLRGCLIALLAAFSLPCFCQGSQPLFKLLPPAATGIHFSNDIIENDTLNILNQANIYNGGGIGIGDFNNDGLVDIYFAGNMKPNKLYLNKGHLRFEDKTAAAHANGEGRWCTGVSVIDINADGKLDIYVAASFTKNVLARTNLLYINQGNDKNNVPQFKEMAAAYGLADTGFSTQGYFFDYDRDGDLDLYLVTNALYDPKTPIRFRPKLKDGSAWNTDRLYRNNGNFTFTNVSQEAGITIEGWGHAAAISDFNNDGWPDIYVANDFVSNDLLYINNRDGSFTNKISDYLKHAAWNAMGTDVADINNDGYPDIISLEMLPEYNLRKKRMLSGNEYYNYFNAQQFGYEHQYVRNVLQLNSGPVPGGNPVFSDIGFMAGIYQTDWSWCPLVADFDNDGYRDLIVTNGLPRDVTDLDYIAYDNKQNGGKADLSLKMAHTLPIVNIPDYAFRNTGSLRFEDVTKSWGLDTAAFSNGGAYADLDNDGDLDFVVNNINGHAFVYENTAARHANFLKLNLSGQGANVNGIGATIKVYHGGKFQYYEHYPSRGYLSTMDFRVHIGLGKYTSVDSIVVSWPDNSISVLNQVKANQVVTIEQKNANLRAKIEQKFSPILIRANDAHDIQFKPTERDFIDYTIQATLPHKLSQYGPGIAVGDIDNNGYEDFYVGGSSGHPGVFFLQDANGKFKLDSTRIARQPNELEEEMGVLFFDCDNDGDLDLYAVTGSYEIPPGHAVAQDRLFINNGKGEFQLAKNALPAEITNGSCVRAADFDHDGDLDLFVGGRVVSGAYPANPTHFILANTEGKFTDVTDILCPQLRDIGMVTDALWSDFDGDGNIDLVLAGEWMPVTFLKNSGGKFSPHRSGIEAKSGWWNSLAAGDFDNDGDIDYMAGNLGLNSNYIASDKEPMTILAKDIDNNGSLDAMLFCYMKAEDGSMKSFPMHAKDDLVSQVISIRKKFPTYTSYGLATMDDLWSASDKSSALVKTANYLQSSYIENKGNGQFVIKPLPPEAQVAPIYGMSAEDIDHDGHLDLLMVGNDYSMEPYSGRHDAFNGLCLKGDGAGNFSAMPLPESGFFVKGDAKAFAKIHTAGNKELYLVSQNQDSLLAFTAQKQPAGWIQLQPDDHFAELEYKDGRKRKQEFYYGSSYLSQSSRYFAADDYVKSVTITNFKGEKRKTNISAASGWKVKTENASYIHRAIKQVTDVMVYDIYSPPVSSRTYAYISLAGYEAALPSHRNYNTLSTQLNGMERSPSTDKEISATIAAVHAMLTVAKNMVISEEKIDSFYRKIVDELKSSGIPSVIFDNSIGHGQAIAKHVLAYAAKDNYKETRALSRYAPMSDAGSWKPTPPAYMKAVEPHWCKIRPFVLDSAQQFKPGIAIPFSPDKNSAFYKDALAVRDIGLKLTDEQKEIANFWDCNPFKMNVNGHVMYASKKISPGGHWINIAALACQKKSAGVMESLDVYACLAIALNDAFISCWDEKYRSLVIRPETYINQYIDTNWVPLLQTPPFPEYPSGHSVVSTAAAVMLEKMFGENFSFADSTELEFGIPVRNFTSFAQAAEEAAISRFYGGIHYMPAIVNGCHEGRAIGNFITQKIKTK